MIDYVRTVLLGSSTITNVVDNDVFIEEAIQAKNPPYIVLDLDGGNPSETKMAASQLDYYNIAVSCYSSTPYTKSGGAVGAFNMSELVRSLLDFHSSGNYFIYATDLQSNYSVSQGNQPLFCTEQEYIIEKRR